MKKVNFQVPLIESFFNKEKSVHQLRNKLLKATLYGLLTGGVIILVSLLVSSPLGVDNSSIKEIPWWLAIFGSFGAAVNEESIFRLFLVTFIVWSLVKVRKRKATPLYTWTGISVAALVFGVMHYSVAILNFDMTVGLFASMLLINGIGGIVFGALFVFMGLEFAIIAHFMANFLIQVIGPLFI
ncbi:CPBP family intramembrane glutamic endopeptidase [Metabacillus iocasae]|nr:CPBP family intramembrane glutamic endopeptidase [Metabacillus iocasae]